MQKIYTTRCLILTLKIDAYQSVLRLIYWNNLLAKAFPNGYDIRFLNSASSGVWKIDFGQVYTLEL